MSPILISNSFPFSLVRRAMRVEPRSVGELLTAMHERSWVSAWGHENTVAAASAISCADLRPATPRPALSLNAENLPSLDGQSFAEVWLLSPDYAPGFRPQIAQEVPAEAILGWQVLCLSFNHQPS
jgi:hypothetical protein